MTSRRYLKGFNRRFPRGALLLLAFCMFGVGLSRSKVLRPLMTAVSSPIQNSTAPASNGDNPPDHKVYPKPPLPRLPRAGGKFIDPTFGTEIMRATDERDDATGLSTFYPHWPTFNSDNTLILVRKASGSALVKPFDATNFNVGASLEPGPVKISGKGDV